MPLSDQPTPRGPFAAAPLYCSARVGTSAPAPGGTAIDTLYVALPSLETPTSAARALRSLKAQSTRQKEQCQRPETMMGAFRTSRR